jgi:hypothetical protein
MRFLLCSFMSWFLIATGVVAQDRQVSLEPRDAVLSPIIYLKEVDTLAVSYVGKSMLIDDSAIAICDPQLEALICYGLNSGSVRWMVRNFPDISLHMHASLPQGAPDYVKPFGADLQKVPIAEYTEAKSRSPLGAFYRVQSFDYWDADSIVITSQAYYAYKNSSGRLFDIAHSLMIVTDTANRTPRIMILPPSMSRNSTPLSTDVVKVGESVWLPAWDYDTRGKDRNYLRSEKYSLLGDFQHVSSFEPKQQTTLQYIHSHQAFSGPFRRNSIVRSISRLRSIDVMNTDDGSYVRHSLPELVNAYFDTLASYTSGAVVLGEQRVAVRVSAGDSRGDVPRDLNMVVLGTISRDGSSLVWTDALTFEGPDMLMGLVQTHRSPRYASSLLVIMQNKEKGFYVARVDQ